MSGSCPTVKVKSDSQEQGFYLLNEADFDPKVHTLFVEVDPDKQPAAKQPQKKK
jgi:hypothetical protein